MRILLEWLVEYAWVVYVVCAIGVLIYLVRAVAAQRERSLALFSLEHETATFRAVRAWATVFAFIAIALIVFTSVIFLANHAAAPDPDLPVPTATPRSGVEPPTPSPTATVAEPLTRPTVEREIVTQAPPTQPPEPTEPPTPAPTATETPTPPATGALSGDLDVRFGDFGKLARYQVASAQVSSGGTLAVTLHWEGLEGASPENYTVFTHLLSEEGRLIAQHDGPPASGAAPTSGWQAGQVIQDRHELSFRPGTEDYAGPAKIMVGLYDPGNPDARLVTSTGQDYVVLPVTITVVQP